MSFSDILKQYPYTTELHAHTFPVSPCGDLSPEEVVKVYREVGATSLVITNHLLPFRAEGDIKANAEEYIEDYLKAKEAAGDDLDVILGVELRFTENNNDYLVFGICEEDIAHFISLLPYGIENFYKEAKNERNVIIQAHPFRKGIELAPIGSIDGIESLNMHPGHNSRVSIGCRYAKLKDLLVTGGTDFHHLGHQGLCLMRTQNRMRDSYDVAAAIKSREVLFDCSGHIIIPYIY